MPYPWLKPGVVIGGLVPLASIGLRAMEGKLSADPVARVENELGLAALVLLVASLACTPARYVFGWTWAIRIRRELGLLAFGYAFLHFMTYLAVDQSFQWSSIVEDILKRPFITVGFAALVLLTPLALTSTRRSVRQLGFKRWQRLHQLAYVAGALAVVHFIWRVKLDASQPLTYAWIVAILLGIRAVVWLRGRSTPRKLGRPMPTRSG